MTQGNEASVEARARELLAAECTDREISQEIRERRDRHLINISWAIRAITKALAPCNPPIIDNGDGVRKAAEIVDEAARSWAWEAGEEDGHAYRLKACAERRARWQSDDECDHDGACEECATEMHEHFETAASKERRRELRGLAARIRNLPCVPPAHAPDPDEYMSVTLSRDGTVQSHNAFEANFDEMVEATRTIITALQDRLYNRLKCPFASGKALREDTPQSVKPDAVRESRNPCSGIFDHKWLDPICVASGCQSLAGRHMMDRLYEVVHHDAECKSIGGNGDQDCTCDAVPVLRELEKAWMLPVGQDALATPSTATVGLDPVTVEACAKVADEELENRRAEQKRDLFDNHLRGQINAATRIATAIRALSHGDRG
jgi:hypothetical protein